jgi:hypothetical protein
MSAVAVEIMPRPTTVRPEVGLRTLPIIRPEADAATVATPVIITVADLDDVMDSVKCSCNAGDDNPH